MGRGLKWLLLGAAVWCAVGLAWRVMIGAPRHIVVTSWWRSPKRNKEVGGVPGSAHLVGMGWDVAPRNADVRTHLENLGLKVLPTDTYTGHLHAQFTWRTPFLLLWRIVDPV